MSDQKDPTTKLMAEVATLAEHRLASEAQKLIDSYAARGLETVLGQNQVLIALTNITGQLIACMPAEQRGFIEDQALKNVVRQRVAAEQHFDRTENGEIDLATAEPAGRC